MTDRVAIVGSRAHPDLEIVRAYVRTLPIGTVVVSGGAEGVDRAAHEVSVEHGIGVAVHWPDSVPLLLGRTISPRDRLLHRNTLIALDCTRMVVFPDGSKGGCWDAAREADRFLRPVEIRWADGRVATYALGSRGKPARRTS